MATPIPADVRTKLVDAVAALQRDHCQQRKRVSPDALLTMVKERDVAFAQVTVRQLRRAVTDANKLPDAMDVEDQQQHESQSQQGYDVQQFQQVVKAWNLRPMLFEPQEPPPNWAEDLERMGFTAGMLSQTHSEECDDWRAGRARRHSI